MERHPNPDMDEYAGVLDRRLEALFLDGIFVGLAVLGLGYLAGMLFADSGIGGMFLAMSFGAPVALLGYQVGMEGYYGQTVGKHLRGIVVVSRDGSDLTWGKAVVRNLLRIVDALPAFYVVGVAAAYVTDDHQRIGDLAGQTVVVHTTD
ncbi:RDD family protein [Halomicrobium salinisoli]|uniref:RDD family protein n=1 Tax=Halomicrobium salinisoli TaxID=2878391 RepID=UPI001CF003CF|nr:RDD family protein [Halomicrobium salinisoli]